MKQERNESGRFDSKSPAYRQVRSIRVTDAVWERLGVAANFRGVTRADLIEELVETGLLDQMSTVSSLNISQIEALVVQIIADPSLTRHGKDRGSVRRALEALLNKLGDGKP